MAAIQVQGDSSRRDSELRVSPQWAGGRPGDRRRRRARSTVAAEAAAARAAIGHHDATDSECAAWSSVTLTEGHGHGHGHGPPAALRLPGQTQCPAISPGLAGLIIVGPGTPCQLRHWRHSRALEPALTRVPSPVMSPVPGAPVARPRPRPGLLRPRTRHSSGQPGRARRLRSRDRNRK
jgi:hypothetical protein